MLSNVLEILALVDSPRASGHEVAAALAAREYADASIDVSTVADQDGATDFIKVTIPGTHGKITGGYAPTLGIVGRLGGVGARPEAIGYVSDGDGAVAALAAAAKLLDMAGKGDRLAGDVIVSTHIDPDAPTEPHEPVPFMSSVVDIATMNEMEVSAEMDAILSIDTTKGNNILNHRGVAISPTVKQGYILRPSGDLIDVYERVAGDHVHILPLCQADITPYGNDLHHINSILQPAVATSAPVVGVALTTVTVVAGSATGASHETDIALAARYVVEVAKSFGSGDLAFFDEDQFAHLVSLYGSNERFQTLGEA